jgi:hypothetical protein
MRTDQVYGLVLLLCVTAPSGALSQTLGSKFSADRLSEVSLSMPEPPIGYVVTKQAIESNGNVQGFIVAVVKEGSQANVVVTVEAGFDRSPRAARVAALKAYVNATAVSFHKAGFELVTKDLPDVEKLDYDKPIQIDLEFANADKKRVLTRQFIFFTKKGYLVQIAAPNEKDLEALSEWARHIRPASEAK